MPKKRHEKLSGYPEAGRILESKSQADSVWSNEEGEIYDNPESTITNEESLASELKDVKIGESKALSARAIQKLKKKKQKGLLTEEELNQYSDVLGVKQSISGKVTKESEMLSQKNNQFSLNDIQVTSGLVGFQQKVATTSMSKDIIFNNVTISYQSKILLNEVDLKLFYGRKYGLVGPNGTGKTTLLRHISTRQLPIQDNIRILHVEQEAEASEKSALLSVLEADTQRMALLEREKELKKLSQLDTEEGIKAEEALIEVYDQLRQIGAYSAEARVSSILSGLQFTESMKKKPTKEFSGGWRMRIALARALFLNPDLLILDEPSNHLDLNAVIWLEAYLRRWKKTLLVVSHDRDFMNYFVTDIIHLDKQKLNYYRGDYDMFEKTLATSNRTDEKSRMKQEKKLDQIQKTQTTKAKDTKKKIQAQGILEKQKKSKIKFRFNNPGKINPPVIKISEVSFAFDKNAPEEEYIFKDVDQYIDLDSKIAIVGPNGAGKSTLVNLITGDLEPTKGEIMRNRKLNIMKFAQHFMDELKLSENAIAYITKNHPGITQQEARTALGFFGLSGKTHTNPISLLSGGQKSRVMFANISLANADIMFLDEPTNHLDIQSVNALIEGLKAFTGGIVVISHDQRLITNVCNELWSVEGDQKVKRYEGIFEEYRQELIDAMDDSIFEALGENETTADPSSSRK